MARLHRAGFNKRLLSFANFIDDDEASGERYSSLIAADGKLVKDKLGKNRREEGARRTQHLGAMLRSRCGPARMGPTDR